MDLDLAYDLDLERDLASRVAPPEDFGVGGSGWLGLYAPVDGGDRDAVPRVSTVLDRVEAWGPCVDTLTVLQGFDPAGLSPFDQVTYLCLVDAHVGWLEGMKQRAVPAVAGRTIRVSIVALSGWPGAAATAPGRDDRWRWISIAR